jgi:hypothetical protein
MEDSRKSGGAVVVVVAIVVIALPVLYVLSIGPAGWLVDHGYVTREHAQIVYYPLILAAMNSTWINSALQAYMSWFA